MQKYFSGDKNQVEKVSAVKSLARIIIFAFEKAREDKSLSYK